MQRPLALITGGARRVGRAIALHLAHQGYDVAFTYLSSKAEALLLIAELRNIGVEALSMQVDLTDLPVGVEQISRHLGNSASRLKCLVNNASIYQPDSAIDSAASMYRIHAEAPLLLARGLSPHLAANHGCIINMCDILGARPMPGWLAYCSSKAALANITMGLARELAPDVRVCGIAPGVAQWPDDYDESARKEYLRRVPLQRAGTPEEVARLAWFLLNDATYITGQIIPIDGGRSIV